MLYLRIVFLFICLVSVQSYSEPVSLDKSPKNDKSVTLSFDRITLSALIEMVYTDILKKSYLIHSEVIQRSEEVTVRLRSTFEVSALNVFMINLLRTYDIQAEQKADYIFFRPVVPLQPETPELINFFYKPRYRDSSYLLSIVGPVIESEAKTDEVASDDLSNLKSSNKRSVPNESGNKSDKGLNKLVDKGTDGLLFTGSQKQLDKLLLLLAEIDTPAPQVNVRAYVYQVSHTSNDSTALHLAFDLLKGQVGLVLGALRSAGQTLTVKTGNVDALFSLFNADTRFRVLSSPSVLVRSGEESVFTVGTETPVLSGMSYPTNGAAAVQNVEYRQSGIIFQVTPKVYRDRIDIDLSQQISDFVATTTGVSNSPTLLKRDLKSNFSLQSGQLVVIGGLLESKNNHDRTFFPFTDWEMASEKTLIKSEILLFLYCEIVSDENLDSSKNYSEFIKQFPDGTMQVF